MEALALTSPPMAPRKSDNPKEQVSLTLSTSNLKALREMASAMEYPPPLSQLVDRAISEFVRNARPSKSTGQKRG